MGVAKLSLVLIFACLLAVITGDSGEVDGGSEPQEQSISIQSDPNQTDDSSGENANANRKRRSLCLRWVCNNGQCYNEQYFCGCPTAYPDDCSGSEPAPADIQGPGPGPFPDLCEQGQFYCGRQLTSMGYNNTHPNALYKCDHKFDGQYHGLCQHNCQEHGQGSQCKCKEGVTYCGYELRLRNILSEYVNDHTLYKCNADGSVTPAAYCWQCHGNSGDPNGRSRCGRMSQPCESGRKYCGFELIALRYRNVEPHSLYECKNLYGGDVELVRECESGCNQGFVRDSPSFCAHGLVAKKPNDRGYGIIYNGVHPNGQTGDGRGYSRGVYDPTRGE